MMAAARPLMRLPALGQRTLVINIHTAFSLRFRCLSLTLSLPFPCAFAAPLLDLVTAFSLCFRCLSLTLSLPFPGAFADFL